MITMRFPKGLKKCLTLSYDDGVRQDKRLVKILDKHGIKATFNINSGLFGNVADKELPNGRMSVEEVKELFGNSPHEVAIHGLYHGWDQTLHSNCMANEILEDRKNIEKLFGRVIRGMAYPFGAFNDKLVDCLRACGIVYSRTVISTERFDIPEDWLRLPATAHHRNPRLNELCDNFLEMDVYLPQMFYLWGHSYEFDNNEEYNNWGVIEEFAEKMGGRDDIWYATNIEAYDYIDAYNRLNISTDETIIHNPSGVDVWVLRRWCENGDYKYSTDCIKAGETKVFNN